MNWLDYLIIITVAVCMFFAVRAIVKSIKNGKNICCGNCSGCKANCSKNTEL